MTAHAQSKRGETGATLVLALVFIVAVALVLVSLGSSVSDGLLNSTNLSNQRSLEYAADGATSIAVQTVRYSGAPYSVTANCLSGGSVAIDGVKVWVVCARNSLSGVFRIVDFYACTEAACSGSNAVLQARVTFNDYAASNQNLCPPTGGPSCGTAMTIDSWILKTANN